MSFRIGEADKKKVEEGLRVLKEAVGEKKMDENNSGNQNDKKGLGSKEEGKIVPLPEMILVSGSPPYKIGRKLGEGGFGKVYVGRRINAQHLHERNDVGAIEVALKFEHRNCKGCNYGPPYEWQVHNALGGSHGIPRLHYKGRKVIITLCNFQVMKKKTMEVDEFGSLRNDSNPQEIIEEEKEVWCNSWRAAPRFRFRGMTLVHCLARRVRAQI